MNNYKIYVKDSNKFGVLEFGVTNPFSGPVLPLSIIDADKAHQDSQMSKKCIAHQEGLLRV